MKSKKQQINYLRKLIKTAKELHNENPKDEYDLLIEHYKRVISNLENEKRIT